MQITALKTIKLLILMNLYITSCTAAALVQKLQG